MTFRSCDSEVVVGPGIHERRTKAIGRGKSDVKPIPSSTITYEFVVVGAGGAGLRATMGMAAGGLKTACNTDAQLHGRGARRHRCCLGQHVG